MKRLSWGAPLIGFVLFAFIIPYFYYLQIIYWIYLLVGFSILAIVSHWLSRYYNDHEELFWSSKIANTICAAFIFGILLFSSLGVELGHEPIYISKGSNELVESSSILKSKNDLVKDCLNRQVSFVKHDTTILDAPLKLYINGNISYVLEKDTESIALLMNDEERKEVEEILMADADQYLLYLQNVPYHESELFSLRTKFHLPIAKEFDFIKEAYFGGDLYIDTR